MAPSAISVSLIFDSGFPVTEKRSGRTKADRVPNTASFLKGYKKTEFLFDRHLHKSFPVVTRAKGNYIHLEDGRKIFDSTSGAAVSSLGHGNQRVINAIYDQMQTGVLYLASSFFSSRVVESFCEELINGTGRKMSRVYLTGSGLLYLSLILWGR